MTNKDKEFRYGQAIRSDFGRPGVLLDKDSYPVGLFDYCQRYKVQWSDGEISWIAEHRIERIK